MAQITWRNINQDTGVRDAVGAMSAAQNSFNASLSSLDKVLGQQQAVEQNRINEGRNVALAEYLQMRDMAMGNQEAYKQSVESGDLARLYETLTPAQQAQYATDFGTQGQNTAYAGEQVTRQRNLQEGLYQNRELYNNILQLAGTNDEAGKDLLSNIADPDQRMAVTQAYEQKLQQRLAAKREEVTFGLKTKEALADIAFTEANTGKTQATTGLIGAQTGETIANTAATQASIPGIQADGLTKTVDAQTLVRNLERDSKLSPNSIFRSNNPMSSIETNTALGMKMAEAYKDGGHDSLAGTIKSVLPTLNTSVVHDGLTIPVPSIVVEQAVTSVIQEKNFDRDIGTNMRSDASVRKLIQDKIDKRMTEPNTLREYMNVLAYPQQGSTKKK